MIRNVIPYLLVGAAAFLTLLSIYGAHGLIHLRELEGELQSVRQKNAALEDQGASLESEIVALRRSPAALEKRAREELGVSRPGEIVYIFPKPRLNSKSDN